VVRRTDQESVQRPDRSVQESISSTPDAPAALVDVKWLVICSVSSIWLMWGREG
jgi:hypothetical protein